MAGVLRLPQAGTSLGPLNYRTNRPALDKSISLLHCGMTDLWAIACYPSVAADLYSRACDRRSPRTCKTKSLHSADRRSSGSPPWNSTLFSLAPAILLGHRVSFPAAGVHDRARVVHRGARRAVPHHRARGLSAHLGVLDHGSSRCRSAWASSPASSCRSSSAPTGAAIPSRRPT